MGWVEEIRTMIDKAISNKSISKEKLAEGLEEIAYHAESWAEQMREELKVGIDGPAHRR